MTNVLQGGIRSEDSSSSTKGKATATNSRKKRAASREVADAEYQGGEARTKKAKVVKKGTAKVVKKPKAEVYSSSEGENAVIGNEEKVPIKPKGKGKGKAAAKPTGPAKAKKGKAGTAAEAGLIPIHEDEDADTDMNGGDAHHDGMIDMQFDEAA